MTLAQALNNGLELLKQQNPGTLVYNGHTITVFKSFLRNENRQMQLDGYTLQYDDLYVLAKPSDVANWNIVPNKTVVKLDNVDYVVGQSTTTTPGYVTIWLRVKH